MDSLNVTNSGKGGEKDGGMEGWRDGWRDGGWMDGWGDGWRDGGWRDGWMDGWMDGVTASVLPAAAEFHTHPQFLQQTASY